MEKETIVIQPPTPPPAGPVKEAPFRTMPLEKAKILIRKTSAQHAGLFRRLAK
jgi:hypothetical protein